MIFDAFVFGNAAAAQVITFELPGVQPSKLVVTPTNGAPLISDFESQEQAVYGLKRLKEEFTRLKNETRQDLINAIQAPAKTSQAPAEVTAEVLQDPQLFESLASVEVSEVVNVEPVTILAEVEFVTIPEVQVTEDTEEQPF